MLLLNRPLNFIHHFYRVPECAKYLGKRGFYKAFRNYAILAFQVDDA